jgi:hypothetical protein
VNSEDMEWITNSYPQLSQLALDPLAIWILLLNHSLVNCIGLM